MKFGQTREIAVKQNIGVAFTKKIEFKGYDHLKDSNWITFLAGTLKSSPKKALREGYYEFISHTVPKLATAKYSRDKNVISNILFYSRGMYFNNQQVDQLGDGIYTVDMQATVC